MLYAIMNQKIIVDERNFIDDAIIMIAREYVRHTIYIIF